MTLSSYSTTPTINYENVSTCEIYDKLRQDYIQKYNMLNEETKRSQIMVKTLQNAREKYKSHMLRYTDEKIDNLLRKELFLLVQAYEIYEVEPFKQYVTEKPMERLCRDNLSRLHTAAGDFKQFKNACHSTNKYQEEHDKAVQFLNAQLKFYQDVNATDYNDCYSYKLGFDMLTSIKDMPNSIQTMKNYRQSLDNYRYNKKYCLVDPTIKLTQVIKERNEIMDPFYTKMTEAMVPYFENIKSEMQSFITQYNQELFENYLNNYKNFTSILNNLKIGSVPIDKEDEIESLLTKTQSDLSSTTYISEDLLNKMKKKIGELQAALNSYKNLDSKTKGFITEITLTLKNLDELTKATSVAINRIQPIKKKIDDYISQINKLPSVSELRDRTFSGKRLNNKIQKFLKETRQSFNTSLNLEFKKVENLYTQVNNNVEKLQRTSDQLKTENTNTLKTYQTLKSEIETITKEEIPLYRKNLNQKKLDDMLSFTNPATKLNDIGSRKEELLKNLGSYESQIDNTQLTTIEDSLTTASETIQKVKDNNDRFKLSLPKNKSSFLITKANEMSGWFSNLVDVTKEKLSQTTINKNNLKSQIDYAQSKINENKVLMNSIIEHTQKLTQDYKNIEEAKKKLSTSKNITPGEFELLISKEKSNLNLNLNNEVEKLSNDIKNYEKSYESIKLMIPGIVDEINKLKSLKSGYEIEVKNMENVHANMVESLEYGLKTVEIMDKTSFTRIKDELTDLFENYKETLNTKSNGYKKENEYYTKTIKEANDKVAKIESINQSSIIVRHLEGEFSVENNFSSLKDLNIACGESVTEVDNKIKNHENELSSISTNYEKNTATLETAKSDIMSLLQKYNTFNNDKSAFSNNDVEIIEKMKVDLKKKFDLFKATTDNMKQELTQLSTMKSNVNSEIAVEAQFIEEYSRNVLNEKTKLNSFFKKLNSFEETASTINEATKKLAEKKGKLNSFLAAIQSQYEKNKDLIKDKQAEISTNGESQTKLLENEKSTTLNKFEEYKAAHNAMLTKSSGLHHDIPEELTLKFNEMEVTQQSLIEKFEENLKNVSETISEANTHYINQQNSIDNEYSEKKSKAADLLDQIQSLLTKIGSETNENNLDELDIKYTVLISTIESFLDRNKDPIKITINNDQIEATIPREAEEFRNKLDTAMIKDEDYVKNLNSNQSSTESVGTTINMVDVSQNSVEHDNHESDHVGLYQSSAALGESNNVLAKDHFKMIVAGAAVALVAMAIAGAVIRYRSVKKNEIYEKCENIYIKA